MISIVMAYYNRRELLINTLKSIEKSGYKDYEIIVVDDASKEEERIEDLNVKVIRVEQKDKWYHNSCIPFNIGIKEAKGDIVIIQNPECFHVHDVLSYVANTVNDSNYVSMSCYSINKNMSILDILDQFMTLPQKSVESYVGWYNHSIYRPVHYNFCCAITKKNLSILGGFDERYAGGTGYEDDDFVDRVKRLRLKMIIADDVSVIHQWHPKVYDINNPIHAQMFRKNGLLHKQTKKENYIKVND
jgi:glycosyltransferase involved in cell wall biosynthesis